MVKGLGWCGVGGWGGGKGAGGGGSGHENLKLTSFQCPLTVVALPLPNMNLQHQKYLAWSKVNSQRGICLKNVFNTVTYVQWSREDERQILNFFVLPIL